MRKTLSERGIALILSLMILVFLASLGGLVLMFNLTSLRAARRVEEMNQVVNMVEMGLHRMMGALAIMPGQETVLNSIHVPIRCQSDDTFGTTPASQNHWATAGGGTSLFRLIFSPIDDANNDGVIDENEANSARYDVIGLSLRDVLAGLYGNALDNQLPNITGVINVFHDKVNVETQVDNAGNLALLDYDFVSPALDPEETFSTGGVATVEVSVQLRRNIDPNAPRFNPPLAERTVRAVFFRRVAEADTGPTPLIVGLNEAPGSNFINGNVAVFGGATIYGEGLNFTDTAMALGGTARMLNSYVFEGDGHPYNQTAINPALKPYLEPLITTRQYQCGNETIDLESLGAKLRVKNGQVELMSNSAGYGAFDDIAGTNPWYDGGPESWVEVNGVKTKLSMDGIYVQSQEMCPSKDYQFALSGTATDPYNFAGDNTEYGVGSATTDWWDGGPDETYISIHTAVDVPGESYQWVDGGKDTNLDGFPDVLYNNDDTARKLFLEHELSAATFSLDEVKTATNNNTLTKLTIDPSRTNTFVLAKDADGNLIQDKAAFDAYDFSQGGGGIYYDKDMKHMTIAGSIILDTNLQLGGDRRGSALAYEGSGSLYVKDSNEVKINCSLIPRDINGNPLPFVPAEGSNENPNILAIMAEGDIAFGRLAQEYACGYFYSDGNIKMGMQWDIVGRCHASTFDLGMNVPRLIGVENLDSHIPRGMITMRSNIMRSTHLTSYQIMGNTGQLPL